MAVGRRRLLLLALFSPAVVAAQSSTAPLLPPAPVSAETPAPPLRRWLELQSVTLLTRYRFLENSADVVTGNQWQYKDVLRARFNFDAGHRYTLNVGVFSGANFISTWNNTGVGTGNPPRFVWTHYLKQLYASAEPVQGFELQYGGIYVVRGEATEWTSYDDDGYAVGERLSLRRKELFLDEIAATRAWIGPYDTPDVTKRWNGLHEANYYQVLLAKRAGRYVRASTDWTHDQGADTWRATVAALFPPSGLLSAVRYEQYWRMDPNPAFGFALWLERPVTSHARLQAGYATVDEHYGGWNADRIQRGKRVFAIGTVPILRKLTASLFFTQAFSSSYPVSNKTRLDVVLSYDLLRTLRRTGIF